MAAYIRGKDHLTIVFDEGDSVTVYPTNPQYLNIVEALNVKDFTKVRALSNPAAVVQEKIARVVKRGVALVELRDGVVYYKDEPLHNTLTDRIIKMSQEGYDIEPMTKFLANLQDNPSFRAVNELYSFLEKGNLPITEDGFFLAYKRVKSDYTDIYTGTISNAVGATVEMPRNQVDEEKSRTCSAGLHFCSRDYLPKYGTSPGNRTIIVKINPADVVAIPADYQETKGRTCRYFVIGELEHQNEAPLEGTFRPSAGYVEPTELPVSELEVEDEDEDDWLDDEDEDDWLDDEDEDEDDFDDGQVIVPSIPNRTVTLQRLNAETGQILDEYFDIADAARDYGTTSAMIRRVLRGERKTTAGYGWKKV